MQIWKDSLDVEEGFTERITNDSDSNNCDDGSNANASWIIASCVVESGIIILLSAPSFDW